ncbi:uroporphyrinogen-III synthase [Immundisolibacter sp.]|uniref:uroporphyrinogen-III synthase n=1 Tax=Immundisolibacter sp. TaxID=1934948 RepID=UPI002622E1D0|nr:uroporphyrinogen-III synthase [Immundisolibacter sp.]MDD3651055.1 uroporphyrinogen-III synthase [Immundisolibacter sp.]
MAEAAAPGVLVTRPAEQAAALCRLLEASGFSPLLLPTLAIEPLDLATPTATLRTALPCELAIFISANAVRHALPVIAAAGGLPDHCALAAVGAASAAALNAAGFRDVVVPQTRFDSEGLLALPDLRAVAGRRVVIFRGEEGRRLLAQTLAARGAEVHEVVCYRRRTAVDQAPRLAAWLAAGAIAALTATSRAGYQALLELAGPRAAAVAELPLAVLAPALGAYARARGQRGPVVSAEHASDEALAAAVRQLLARPRNHPC